MLRYVLLCTLKRDSRVQVLFRGDYAVDDFIDVVEGNRKFVQCIYVYNKVHSTSVAWKCCVLNDRRLTCWLWKKSTRWLAGQILLYAPLVVELLSNAYSMQVLSCNLKLNFDGLLEAIWDYLGLVRVYTKRKGEVNLWLGNGSSKLRIRSLIFKNPLYSRKVAMGSPLNLLSSRWLKTVVPCELFSHFISFTKAFYKSLSMHWFGVVVPNIILRNVAFIIHCKTKMCFRSACFGLSPWLTQHRL